jgi:DNA-binding winged helix-turn-helix (wHTH) protein/tetratricopeptide (TPR) repeat protein
MDSVHESRYEFGPFSLDARRHVLLRDGQAISLAPKVFETLLLLVRNSGQVLKKNELMEAIWPDTFVEESNLAQHIFLLRKILGEEKSEHRYIVTVPGAGYRFVAQVRESVNSENTFQQTAQPDSAGDVWPPASLAVLPFKRIAGAKDDEALGLGIADALIMKLSGLRLVRVRPTTSVLKYAETTVEPLSAGRELRVDALLDGYYQRHGDQLRVSVQLIRVKDAMTIWAAKFDESFSNFFAIQDSVSEQVVRELELKLSSAEKTRLKKNYTDNPEALHAFIKGRYFWNRRTTGALKRGLEYANQAIALDPAYAAAYVGIADTYNLLGAQHSVLSPKEAFPKARAAAERALEIDPGMAEAYASIGFVNYCFDWDRETSERNFRKAIELKPNYPTAHHWYGELLSSSGRFTEAVAEMQQALTLDPLSLAIMTDLGATFYYEREYDRSESALREAMEVDPGFVRAYLVLAAVQEQKGAYDEAIASLRKASALAEDDPVILSSLAHACAVAGKTWEARAMLKELLQLSERRYLPPCSIALIYTGLGEFEAAHNWLEKAFEARDMNLVWLKVNPRFDPLRARAGFKELLRRVCAPQADG